MVCTRIIGDCRQGVKMESPCRAMGLLSLMLAAQIVQGAEGLGDRAAAPGVAEEKQTVLGLYISAEEAFQQWRADPAQVKILDVRTPEEYIFVGHAEMAINIPLAFQSYRWNTNDKSFEFKTNPDFLREVQAWAKPEDRVLVMCRSGGRSAIAVNKLAKAGYRYVYNIIDGMEGGLVQDTSSPHHGKHRLNGWKNAGNPWTYALDPDKLRLPGKSFEQAE